MPDNAQPLDLSDDAFSELGDTGLDEMVAAAEAEAEAQAQADADADADADSNDNDNNADAPADDENADEEDDDLPGSDEEDANSDDKADDDSVLDGADDDLSAEIPGDDKDASDDDTKDKDKDKDKDNKDGSDDATDDADNADVDYKAQVEAIMAPFMANGKEMQIDSVEDVISLMQMGANYNKKMAGLKPNLKMLKMLENNSLLDEDKLSYLIDLSKKDPAAINKLIKESGVNPLEIDVEKEHGYETNKTYTVSDNEVNLDGILSDIRDTESFAQTIDIVSNKWDAQSRQVLLDNPDVIRSINDHVGNGIYTQIMSVVERERMLGRLSGMSDLESYKHVGDAIQEAGGFNIVDNDDDAGDVDQNVDKANTNNKVDPKTKARKKAAGSTKTTVRKPKKNVEDYDPLSMSDADFEKLEASNLF